MTIKALAALLVAAVWLNAHAGTTSGPDEAPSKVKLAAKEIRRYVYLRAGKLLPATAKAGEMALRADGALEAEQYRLESDGKTLTVTGGSELGAL